MKKTSCLKQMILDPELDFLMEAHNGISAKIVEESGFGGIWASGLSISTALGVRDNNEASWTQILEVVEFMADATSIPILLDGDTGYGNFNNVRRLVKKLEQRSVAGVCIEDKVFPKTNSFLGNRPQPLVGIEEFTGKIKAGKDAQSDPDFVLVARIEAFIAGWGLREAIKRAEAYHEAGADAILIHSKQATPDEILSFLKEWANRAAVILVPTKYYTTPTDVFRRSRVSIVIWANHLIRGAIHKMKDVAARIRRDENLLGVEDAISPLSEVFRLQGDDELKEAEKRYASARHDSHAAIILAASRGQDLDALTLDMPKAMIKIGKKPILERTVEILQDYFIKDIFVVGGYKKEAITLPHVHLLENPDYGRTGELVSLSHAISHVSGPTLVLFGDIIFKKYVPLVSMQDPADVVIVVDMDIPRTENGSRASDYVFTSGKIEFFEDEIFLQKMIFAPFEPAFDAEWIGMMKLSEKGVQNVKSFIERFSDDPAFSQMQLSDMLNFFVDSGAPVKIQYIRGHWIDVDGLKDLNSAATLLE